MPFNVSTLREDPTKVRNGVVFPLGPDAGVRLAPLFGTRYARALARERRPWARAERRGVLPDSVAADTQRRAMAIAVVLDWSGLQRTDDDGQVVDVGPYAQRKAYELLRSEPGFQMWVEEKASDRSSYR